MGRPEISVVMPTYNKAAWLRRTLSAWRQQRFEDYEIVLVDDGSTDRTREVVAEFEGTLPIRFLTGEHRGRSAARNGAIAVARGRTIVFTDDDRIVSPTFLAEHARAGAHHDIVIGWQRGVLVELRRDVALSPRLAFELGRLRPGWEHEAAETGTLELLRAEDLSEGASLVEAFAFDDDWFCRFVEPAVADYGNDISDCGLCWMFGTTGNMSMSAALLARVGGFDESLTGWGLEDTELHYRLVGAGASTYVCREAVNYHQNHPRNEGELMHEWVQNAVRVYEKHTTLEMALYLRLVLGKLSLREMDRIIHEARSLQGSALLANFEALQRSHVLQLAEARRDTHLWASSRS